MTLANRYVELMTCSTFVNSGVAMWGVLSGVLLFGLFFLDIIPVSGRLESDWVALAVYGGVMAIIGTGIAYYRLTSARNTLFLLWQEYERRGYAAGNWFRSALAGFGKMMGVILDVDFITELIVEAGAQLVESAQSDDERELAVALKVWGERVEALESRIHWGWLWVCGVVVGCYFLESNFHWVTS